MGSSRISTCGVADEGLDDLDPLLDPHREVLDEGVDRHLEPVALGDLADLVAGARLLRNPKRVRSWPSSTFSATVNTGISMKCWCTMPMPARIASPGPAKVTGSPSMRISPSSGW